VDLKAKSAIAVVPLGEDERPWQEFLSRSANGTLFHDLEFLRYHPEGRFRFQHLILKRDNQPVALLPGGLDGSECRPMFCSPLGASTGGLIVAEPLRVEWALEMVEAVQSYARTQGWRALQITLPPNYYHSATADQISFALFCRGFRLEHRWLCPVINLVLKPKSFETIYRSRQASFVRAGQRKGVHCIETGLEGFADFLTPFRDTYARHGVPPTHSEEEILDLLTRLPDRVRIHLAKLGQEPVAALLVFRLNATVSTTFYICTSAKHSREHGASIVIADAMDRLAGRGYRYLDLGPAASDMKFNRGVTFFKEGLGAVGQCRDRWRWDVDG
jgi:hypothetical protein